jgi:hypothetical protein
MLSHEAKETPRDGEAIWLPGGADWPPPLYNTLGVWHAFVHVHCIT